MNEAYISVMAKKIAAIRVEVEEFACFDTSSQVVETVKNEFGIVLSRQQVETHAPIKTSGKGLAAKWQILFNDIRKRFFEEMAEIPIANRAYRLRVLGRMADKAENMKNMALTA